MGETNEIKHIRGSPSETCHVHSAIGLPTTFRTKKESEEVANRDMGVLGCSGGESRENQAGRWALSSV